MMGVGPSDFLGLKFWPKGFFWSTKDNARIFLGC